MVVVRPCQHHYQITHREAEAVGSRITNIKLLHFVHKVILVVFIEFMQINRNSLPERTDS
ncbi:hypothetical protein HanRHA438_Chr17g0811571 [Helianthus annuus]|nr:hypothetical protein HanIR_Chr17g0869321 [Helianthus annuus]KAJ0813061.1 hypothetical protein HanPSC8_Chr17g0769161 [Helianthus annuus]KAJ0826191.1 hypothetical protein HanRHA438_Chr17g0811571 [Helianthus annuus]